MCNIYCRSRYAHRFQIQNVGHKDFEPSKNEKSLPPWLFAPKILFHFFLNFIFKIIKKYFFFFTSCFYLEKWPSYFTLCENGHFTKMCTTVHKINFFDFFPQNLKIYYSEMVQFIFEGSRTNFIFGQN